jgi:uncharacterized membrane protein
VIEQHQLWRQDLLRFVKRLEKRYRQKKWSDRVRHNVEKEIFLSFFIIRKLVESGHVTKSVSGSHHLVMWYPIIIGENPSTNPPDFVFTYLLYHGWREHWTPAELSNQLIHSFIFSPFTPWHRAMMGLYFASGDQSKVGLYYITLVKLIEIMVLVGKNQPIKLKLNRLKNVFGVSLPV